MHVLVGELVAAFHALGDNITLTWMSFLCLFEEFACLSSYRCLTSLSTRVMSACFCREEVVLDVWRGGRQFCMCIFKELHHQLDIFSHISTVAFLEKHASDLLDLLQ